LKWCSACSRFKQLSASLDCLELLYTLKVQSGRMREVFFKSAVATGAVLLTACATAPPAPLSKTDVPASAVSIAVASPTSVVKSRSLATPTAGFKIESPIDLAVPDFANGLTRLDLTFSESSKELERGGASWYGPGFHGKRTANGERYDMNAMTAAHKTLPFGTMVRVKSLVNGREVLVRITDRGPFIRNRIIDLSRAAAAELGMLSLGFKQVVLMVAEGEVAGKPARVVKSRLGLKR
jgi:rare lipoprotein A